MDEPFGGPDITLTLDAEGVIRDAVASGELTNESLDPWRGLNFAATAAPSSGHSATRLIEAARRGGRSSSRRIDQKLPSGRETPIEYTLVSLGSTRGFIAIGRNLQAVADLQARLAEAQQARERDYWKLRDVETRYRALLETSRDAVVLVRPVNLRVVEANAEAIRALKLAPGAEFLPDLSAKDRRALDGALATARTRGRAPSIVVHLGPEAPWSLRATQISSESGQFYLFHLAPIGAVETAVDAAPLADVLQRFPEAFALVDRDGIVRRANYAFLDLAQLGGENAALGQNLNRWLSQPGADASVLLNIVHRQGSVRRMQSVVEGDFGAPTEVEISAVGNCADHPEFVGVFLRDARRNAEPPGAVALTELKFPDATLEDVVRASVETIERRSIEEAIVKSLGNRTAAARYLGISRQSLHTKLRKYRIDSN
jgi:transcriptional regulator PpsR